MSRKSWRCGAQQSAPSSELPPESPDRPVVQLQVIRLQRIYARLTTLSAPATWNVLESTRETIDEARRVLADADERIARPVPLGRTERLMEDWLVAEQALTRVDEASPNRATLTRTADDARNRYQATIDEVEPDVSA